MVNNILGSLLVVGSALSLGAQQKSAAVYVHSPSVEVLGADCETIRNAATTYLKTRGIEVIRYRDKNVTLWCPSGRCYTYHLRIKQLLDDNRTPMTWDQVKQRYTTDGSMPREHEAEQHWNRGGGYWEAASNWVLGGYLEMRDEENSCFVRIDYWYGRGINQFFLFFPIDEYNDAFTINDRLQAESLSGIRKTAGLK